MTNKLRKKEFMEKYEYSPSTYQKRMALLRNTPIFREAYERVTSQEVWINIDIYDKFLSYLAHNRGRTRKVTPEEYLKGA
ncbi:hypothetical protein ACSFB8_07590 [Enterococcus faecalis]